MDQVQTILLARRRRARILKLHAEGKSLAEIARLEGCSRQRIFVIVNRGAERPAPPECELCGWPKRSLFHRVNCKAGKRKRAR